MGDTTLVKLSHLMATFRSVDVIANNIANASTPGYKRESVQFAEFVKKMPAGEGETEPELVHMVQVAGVVRNLSQGSLDHTGAPLDLAINGNGYFAIQAPQGERYTRNGHFQLDATGALVTSDGAPIEGEGGSITITADDGDIHVAQDGTVSGKRGSIGKLRLVSFANESAMKKEGASLYSTDQTPKAASGSIAQGSIEMSNVEPVIEISRMIEVMRAYQATANLLEPTNGEIEELQRLGSIPST